jgi:hypothetical protein
VAGNCHFVYEINAILFSICCINVAVTMKLCQYIIIIIIIIIIIVITCLSHEQTFTFKWIVVT